MIRHRFGARPIPLTLLSGILFVAGMAAAAGPALCQSAPPADTGRPESAESAQPAHDPANPPIDCPLHKHGIDPDQLRPVEDVGEYIAFLDSPERAAWQRPDEVVAALDLQGTETVVDLGAGGGYFTFRLAKALPEGKVIATDIEPEMIRHIHHKVMTEEIKNVQAVLIEPTNPMLPHGVDLVFICDVLHHVSDRPAWLGKLDGEIGPGTRLVIVEFKAGDLPKGPPESMKIPRAKILELMAGAGFELVLEKPELLPYQLFLEFRKP
jgi:SAM-dependent methyltransferase